MPTLKLRDLRLNALRAFESAARQLSFSGAAKELGVTHSAVSHQIRQLEEQIGLQLFQRSRHGIELSSYGRRLQPVLSGAFDDILSSLAELCSASREDRLHITTTPTFAIRWLTSPFELKVRHEFSYYLVYPAIKHGSQALALFRNWIVAQ